MRIWDYELPKGWEPKTERQWRWFLVRKINYGDFAGLTRETMRKFFPRIKHLLDPGKRQMIVNFLKQ